MKLFQKKFFWVVTTFALVLGYLGSCTNDDQILDTGTTTNSSTDLVAVKTSTAPAIDGVVDDIWKNASVMSTITQVPDPGNGMFAGYIGTKYPINLRSMYDDQHIYFLAEYPDENKSVNVSPWYFDSKTKKWAQEPSARTFDANGKMTREGWGEDKLSFLWNVDNSTAKFASQTCYASCHMFTPYLDPTTTPATMKANQSGNHYTNGANEKIDMWWLKIGRDPIFKQMSDEFQDWAGGPSYSSLVGGSANGRHQDDQMVTGVASANYPFGPTYSANVGGTSNNTQKLDITGKTPKVSVNVPKYIIPGRTDYYYILKSEVDSKTAKTITAVDSLGVLTLEDGTTIDPNVGTDYQRIGDNVSGGVGAKSVPSYISAPLTNGRADITCQAVYTGSSWIIEWKRLLKTPDVFKQDVDFSSLDDQPFGVAIFNKSNYQHGIKPNLVLKFKK
ncbi:MAG: ethylbenzene dehydrogenase-related protein [Saprospiraceae bacterium]